MQALNTGTSETIRFSVAIPPKRNSPPSEPSPATWIIAATAIITIAAAAGYLFLKRKK